MTKLDDIRKLNAEYKAAIQDHGAKVLKDMFADFFAENPGIIALRWEQYTPYFNDGEPCEFDVYGFYFLDTSASADKDGDEDGAFVDAYTARHDSDPKQAARGATVEAFESRVKDEDVFRFVFGDHVRVTATPDGFEVEEYDHD
jgi:hypothetical protein